MSNAFKTALDPKYAKLCKQARFQVENGTKNAAINAATLFLDRYPRDAEANYNFARALVRQEKKNVALAHAEVANKLSPNMANYIFLLGRLYLDFSLFEFAAPLLRDAVLNLPNNILIQWAMADLFYALGDGGRALQHYQKALSLTPDAYQRPHLLIDYAKCLQTNAAKEEANAVYEELESIDGYELEALAKRSTVIKNKPDSTIAQRLISTLKIKNLNKEIRSEILLSLGNMHENAGDFDQAFELWSNSRSLKTITRERDVGYRALDHITNFYTTELLRAARPFGHQSERPLFVAGMPRSGTTLTEQIVSGHSEIFGVGELGRMHRLEKAFVTDYSSANHVERILKNSAKGELIARAEETLRLLDVLAGPTPKYVVDKLPSQYLSMGYTHLCFPKAKFIHCQRHPADSFISSFQNNMSQFHEYSFDQTVYAEAYLTKERIMAHWRSIFPDLIFELKYETLVSHPEKAVREMLDFIGLGWDPKCMQFFEQARTVKTFSQDQVRKPIYTSSIYRWKKYEKHLGPLFAALKEANFEYPEF
jgi:tetratricopeptide (TPR) repeat protein